MEGDRPPSWWDHEILDIVEDEGLPAERVVMGHQDMVDEIDHPDIDLQLELAERGAFVEFDLWGWTEYITSMDHAAPSDNWRAAATMELIEQDLESQLLFSQDINHEWQRIAYGAMATHTSWRTSSRCSTTTALIRNQSITFWWTIPGGCSPSWSQFNSLAPTRSETHRAG